MSKVLITGATGFLGSNLARKCVQEGFETHILTRKTSRKWRINDILSDLIEHSSDLSNYNKLVKILQQIKPEIIFHFAAYGTHPNFQVDIKRIIETNFEGSVNLIKAANTIEYSLLINAGSSSEYGMKTSPMTETDLLEPMSLYAVTKAASTHFSQLTAKTNGKPIVTVRPFSVYGYFEEPIRLIPATIWHCLKGKDIELSNGKNSMDFIFIDDVVEACMRLIDVPCVGGQIINLGTGELHTIREVVQKILNITQSNIKLNWGKLPPSKNVPELWAANMTKMQEILKWAPRYNLDSGLKKTIVWMKENIDLYNNLGIEDW
jgi:nucleoside-diphosphate-sugar epimerase